ncbi:MAG: Transcriptional regulator, MarR family [uncultured Quadrisphaera sp.]|uniref:Transcriptional regulator, MarR family n=1 Tax=uncultured Quadrisphaera sp. TaxID=904978 RepID=A0A6J4PR44_9ACTN|nr:MAG: Transcriptional regulator, MarR family [uncultured Quadrisphaera sp.]
MDDGPDDDRRAATSAVMDETFALTRLLTTLRAQKNDRSARLLLLHLGRSGQLRQQALAELSHADPSTISRHVADLVAQGLVHRLPDPADGRASLLALTDEGRTALAELRREREERAAAALGGWSTEELTAFAASLARYTHDLEGLLAGPARTPHPGSAEPRAASEEDRA